MSKKKGSTLVETLLLIPVTGLVFMTLCGLPVLYAAYTELAADVYLQSRAQIYGIKTGCSTDHLRGKYPDSVRFEISCAQTGCTTLKAKAFDYTFSFTSNLNKNCI